VAECGGQRGTSEILRSQRTSERKLKFETLFKLRSYKQDKSKQLLHTTGDTPTLADDSSSDEVIVVADNHGAAVSARASYRIKRDNLHLSGAEFAGIQPEIGSTSRINGREWRTSAANAASNALDW
jgi:hypothetical protein